MPVCLISPLRIGAPNGRILPISSPIPALFEAYFAIISPAAKILSKVSSAVINTHELNCLVVVPSPASTGVASVKCPSLALS